ncbi:MAG: 4Fe-4S binding protein [Methanosarcinaceae archaeon]|jgi:Pyruvate/2-oxoacid:ferredoxin oxidoreductase delta subunit|nr:4Fe-4S binding protein [Methanosarcinaceae archaeon]NKQ38418.1 4Fe-4S binding protein [Methanosarcinales archaeon]
MPFTINLDKEACTGCKKCIFVCPEPNVIMYEKESRKVEFNIRGCKACGLCSKFCPFDALEIGFI